MLPDTVNKRLEALGTLSKQHKRINGLFRLMESPSLWEQAYANIYANKGATTPGVGKVTMDGFTMERAINLIEWLKDNRYSPYPARRTRIPKPNGKTRPLGMSEGDDKLVQEVVRMLLERIYEPIFSDRSFGFRPQRSCHMALDDIQRTWTGVKWMVEVDIEGYFDNIDQAILLKLLEKKIDDRRFLALIKAMLRAGYVEDWTFHKTYSGTPQGGIASPILANIYLHELDVCMEEMATRFHKGKKRQPNQEYTAYSYQIKLLRDKITRRKTRGIDDPPEFRELLRQISQLDEKRKALPSVDLWDEAYKRLWYCRYADDFVIGIIGSKEDAVRVLHEVTWFLKTTLHLNIAAAKTGVHHAHTGITFLGYGVQIYTSNKIAKVKKPGSTFYTRARTISEHLQLRIPQEKMRKLCQDKGYGDFDRCTSQARAGHLYRSDLEIILSYNAEFRGFANYYCLAVKAKTDMRKLQYLWTGSLLKTLAEKHKTTVVKTKKRLTVGHDLVYTYEAKGKMRRLRVFRLKDLKAPPKMWHEVDVCPQTAMYTSHRTEILARLNAERCEYCGQKGGYFEVHHVKKLKDLKGQEPWERVMIAMNRKTLVACHECHHLLHVGRLPDWRYQSR